MQLKNHEVVHRAGLSKECPVCKKKYLRLSGLQRHVRKAHSAIADQLYIQQGWRQHRVGLPAIKYDDDDDDDFDPDEEEDDFDPVCVYCKHEVIQ
jgi:hypothetical protein